MGPMGLMRPMMLHASCGSSGALQHLAGPGLEGGEHRTDVLKFVLFRVFLERQRPSAGLCSEFVHPRSIAFRKVEVQNGTCGFWRHLPVRMKDAHPDFNFGF